MVQDDVLESTDCNTFEEIQALVPVKEYLSVWCICFEQGVPWNSGNYRGWIYSETHMWHD